MPVFLQSLIDVSTRGTRFRLFIERVQVYRDLNYDLDIVAP
jgi:hypothetical protein